MDKSFKQKLLTQCAAHLNKLCQKIQNRSLGSSGNQEATAYFKRQLEQFDWSTETQVFDVIDWEEDGAQLIAGEKQFILNVSPYSLGCDSQAVLLEASSISQLEDLEAEGSILLLHGELAKEQLMPKNFVFYNPERHQKIIHLLEQSGAKALIFANSDKSKMAGGMYPYPVIEDGDFDIPSVYIEGEKKDEIQMYVGQKVQLISRSKRIPSEGMNVIGRKGDNSKERIVITAHIDAKKGSPGAIDNASGITAQLLLAELLKGYKGKSMLEIVALNGEDYYSVPGQMKYISENREQFQDMLLNINIDGVGYKKGASSITYYQVTDEIGVKIKNAIKPEHGLVEGTPWPQGDHSIFIQKSVPAIAFTSNWLIDHLDEQDITHTDRDRLDVLNPEKIVRLAEGVGSIVMRISN